MPKEASSAHKNGSVAASERIGKTLEKSAPGSAMGQVEETDAGEADASRRGFESDRDADEQPIELAGRATRKTGQLTERRKEEGWVQNHLLKESCSSNKGSNHEEKEGYANSTSLKRKVKAQGPRYSAA